MKPAGGEVGIGDSHGEIAVAKNGEVYVSVTGGPNPGIQVFSGEGKYLRNVPGAPTDLHGFTIVREGDKEFIYGAGVSSGKVYKLTLEGEVVLEIATTETEAASLMKKSKDGKAMPKLTSADALPNGEIFVVDGYGSDHIFRFDQKGTYLGAFGGKKAPLSLSNCHKVFVDPRYDEPRLLLCDRKNLRLVHTTLEGELISEFATDLRRPSAASFFEDLVVVAEIKGRISVFDKEGKMVATMGTNEEGPISTNKVEPEIWKTGISNSPHGIAFDNEGNILMAEWNKWGRLLKFRLQK